MGYSQDIRVRYGEVAAQEVVFNAHYLAYLDDVADTWLRGLDAVSYTHLKLPTILLV